MRAWTVFVSLAIASAFSTSAVADAQETPEEFLSLGSDHSVVTAETFAAIRDTLLAEIETGETYSEITPQQRAEVKTSLNWMSTWLEAAGSLEQMDEEQRIRLFNEQEKINTTLTGVAADSRMVCTREQTVGSRRRQTTCFTVAERRRRREADSEDAKRFFLAPQVNSR